MKNRVTFFGCCWAITTQAKTVPSELLDIPIEDLLQTRVVTEASAQLQRGVDWHMSYSTQRASFWDNYIGLNLTLQLLMAGTESSHGAA